MYSALLKLPAHLSQDDVQHLSSALDDLSSACSALHENNDEHAPWAVEWVLTEKPDPEHLTARMLLGAAIKDISLPDISLSDWRISPVPDIDWLERSYKQFPPFSIGPFFIYGSHYEGKTPDGQISLQIDAATAFGSGEHGTTKGCLQAMLDLQESGVCPWNILDMGTGSGILGIAAWKLWKTPVLAIDIDEEPVRVACHHQNINNVPANNTGMICLRGDGFENDTVQTKKPFDLIIANILAETLKPMVTDIKAASDTNGIIILSGILQEQAAEILQTYEAAEFTFKKRYDIGEWSTLVLQNTAA